MKKINYQEILKEAGQKEISPHTIIKRKLNYRKATEAEYLWVCDGCAQKCKTAGVFPENSCMLNVNPPNWQPTNQ